MKRKKAVIKAKQEKFSWNKFIHAHAYYVFSVFSLALFFMILTQAVYTQVATKQYYLAAVYYFLSAILAVMTRRSYRRGKKFYSY